MNTYLEKLNAYFLASGSEEKVQEPVLEALYRVYADFRIDSTPVIREKFRQLEESVCMLSLEENNQVSDIVCDLCTEHERAAFYEGIRIGARLVLELNA